ncbi:hypothetical protein M378DRAFT_19419 [Amanita muscaria Koide BX008]|uniref:Tyrosine-protein kinase catalytic domain-containing protein n=1 Tax=Amanita muscaria (strain Koide BX008) TaxID=946122 RepID=A0A0C2RUJ0_AMAMK|nr:hypothetical protein M378DRAFT_19419 [Amanita muscaria Koide BX008]
MAHIPKILSQTIFAGRFLDRRYIVPVLGVKELEEGFLLLGDAQRDVLTMRRWRQGSIPSSVTVIPVMLRLAKAIQYLHSMGVVLYHQLSSRNVLLDSNLYPKIRCLCSTSRSLLDKECQEWFSPDDNIFSFGCLFYEMYAGDIWPDDSIYSRKPFITKCPSVPEIPEYAWQLIQRCCAEHPKSRPTIDEVVNEMKGWHNVKQVEPDEIVNELEGWRSGEHVEPPRQGRTCFRALGSVLSDLRRNLC